MKFEVWLCVTKKKYLLYIFPIMDLHVIRKQLTWKADVLCSFYRWKQQKKKIIQKHCNTSQPNITINMKCEITPQKIFKSLTCSLLLVTANDYWNLKMYLSYHQSGPRFWCQPWQVWQSSLEPRPVAYPLWLWHQGAAGTQNATFKTLTSLLLVYKQLTPHTMFHIT